MSSCRPFISMSFRLISIVNSLTFCSNSGSFSTACLASPSSSTRLSLVSSDDASCFRNASSSILAPLRPRDSCSMAAKLPCLSTPSLFSSPSSSSLSMPPSVSCRIDAWSVASTSSFAFAGEIAWLLFSCWANSAAATLSARSSSCFSMSVLRRRSTSSCSSRDSISERYLCSLSTTVCIISLRTFAAPSDARRSRRVVSSFIFLSSSSSSSTLDSCDSIVAVSASMVSCDDAISSSFSFKMRRLRFSLERRSFRSFVSLSTCVMLSSNSDLSLVSSSAHAADLVLFCRSVLSN
mmetsp:Transcript_35258/g.84232  ORF Transcript_35258/g.84232 Transcript_35258/m.84232 type:complete len:294 (+) Transcript_35258:185-1066(+)